MKFVTYRENGQEKIGVWNRAETHVYPVSAAGLSYADMNGLIEKITDGEKRQLRLLTEKALSEVSGAADKDAVKLLSPIPHPKQDVICLGINYMAHAEESARYKKEAFGGERPYAIYFSKRVNEAVADGGVIPAHENLVDSLDYECELAVVIGKEAKNVRKEDVQDYLFGYTILNDVSARNVQTRHKQWYFGKSLDGFTPMGPCITAAEDIAFPPHLTIQSRVNGELRQNSNTNLLIFDIAHIISELSQGMTLQAGTIIATGTPAGVGMGFTPPDFLKPGDMVECIIEGIGSIKNTVE